MGSKMRISNYIIENMHEWAARKEGKCLSKKYVNNRLKLEWECKDGHRWRASWNNIKEKNSWCPHCCGNVRKNIDDMYKLAKHRNGKCLSKKYINWKTKLKWQCSNGHKWFAKPNSIQNGTWCPHCSVNYMEEKCRHVFENIFRVPFTRNKKILGDNLELDGFNKSKNIAFEYNGKQHYEYSSFFHSSIQDFIRQQNRDERKQELCHLKSIYLITIPYHYQNDIELVNFISKSLGISNTINISFNDFYPRLDQIQKLNKLVHAKGGKLLSKQYLGVDIKLQWKCKHGHIWWAVPCCIKSGTWCPYCSRNAHWSLNDIKKFAETNSCTCLSEEYINAKTPMEWKCNKCGHHRTISYDQIKRKWCLNCGKNT